MGVTIGGHFFGLLGAKGFMLQGAGYDSSAFALFLFQMVFMDTTAAHPHHRRERRNVGNSPHS